jgi:hypothetical protein
MDTVCESRCSSGRHYITEDEHVAMLTAVEGTGQPIVTSFGFGGAGRVWIDCPWCRSHEPSRREAIVETIRVWLDVKRKAKAVPVPPC